MISSLAVKVLTIKLIYYKTTLGYYYFAILLSKITPNKYLIGQ